MRVHKGCPVCSADVVGTKDTGFYCKECNIIYRRRHVNYRDAALEVKHLVIRHFSEVPRSEPTEPRRRDYSFPSMKPAPEPVNEQIDIITMSQMHRAVKKAAAKAKRTGAKLEKKSAQKVPKKVEKKRKKKGAQRKTPPKKRVRKALRRRH